jgi:filamentous hemagglutinin
MMQGQANSDSTTYNNSHASAGNAVNITSGADTNVLGGNIKANKATKAKRPRLGPVLQSSQEHSKTKPQYENASATSSDTFLPNVLHR